MSKLMRDRVVKPLDQAMYWIEYVIRNKGVHFDTPVIKMYWFQVYMIDILCFIVFNLVVFYFVLKYLYNFLRKDKCNNNSTENNKKKRE